MSTLSRPIEGVGDRVNGFVHWVPRPSHNNHRKAALPGSIELRFSMHPAAVFCDKQVDSMIVDQCELTFKRVRTPTQEQLMLLRQRRFRWIHAAHQKPNVFYTRKRWKALTAGRQQHPIAERRNQGCRASEIVSPSPVVARALIPARTLKPQRCDVDATAGPLGRCGNSLGKRVRRVDHGGDAVVNDPIRKCLGTAEPADSDVSARQPRTGNAPRERGRHWHAGCNQVVGQFTSLGSTTKDQDHAATAQETQ